MKRALIFFLGVMLLLMATSQIADAASPPTVATGAVTAIQPTSVVVNGTVNPDGASTTWYFEYGPSSTPGFPARTPSKSAGSGFSDVRVSTTLAGLSPSSSYDYRIVAVSRSGTAVGSPGYFNTSAAPSVVTASASAIGATSATLNGSINPQGLATSWYFQYGTTAAYGARTPEHALGAGPNPVNVGAAVTNLAAKTTYHFRLVAVSSAGTTLGTSATFTTGLAVTLNASTTTITYRQFVTLSGAIASGKPNIQVTVLSEAFDQTSYTTLAAVTTGAGGTWSYTVQPNVRTSYEASISNGSSSTLLISVRPIVTLKLESGGRLMTTVTGAESFAAHVLQLQRLLNNTWVTWKHVRLNARASTTFSTSLPKGRTLVRMAIGPFTPGIDQAGPGYLAGFSRNISYLKS